MAHKAQPNMPAFNTFGRPVVGERARMGGGTA